MCLCVETFAGGSSCIRIGDSLYTEEAIYYCTSRALTSKNALDWIQMTSLGLQVSNKLRCFHSILFWKVRELSGRIYLGIRITINMNVCGDNKQVTTIVTSFFSDIIDFSKQAAHSLSLIWIKSCTADSSLALEAMPKPVFPSAEHLRISVQWKHVLRTNSVKQR